MILGITGTLGSGKETVADYLVEEKGFIHHSLSDIVRVETGKQGLEQNRDNWVMIGNEIREEYGNGELAKRLLDLIKENKEPNSVVTSIRTPGEIEIFKSSDSTFYLLAIDAPLKTRYFRVSSRGNLADQISFEKFMEQESREMVGIGSSQQLAACLAMADETIDNSETKKQLRSNIDNVLLKLNES